MGGWVEGEVYVCVHFKKKKRAQNTFSTVLVPFVSATVCMTENMLEWSCLHVKFVQGKLATVS